MLAQTALKYDAEVTENGLVELNVPFPPGAHVTVFVVEAGESSLGFWNNPLDDENWNDA